MTKHDITFKISGSKISIKFGISSVGRLPEVCVGFRDSGFVGQVEYCETQFAMERGKRKGIEGRA